MILALYAVHTLESRYAAQVQPRIKPNTCERTPSPKCNAFGLRPWPTKVLDFNLVSKGQVSTRRVRSSFAPCHAPTGSTGTLRGGRRPHLRRRWRTAHTGFPSWDDTRTRPLFPDRSCGS